ncbi:Serine/threonine-protein kinase PknH [Planctomycetes bacterium Poly30]|uniref:Serine/threonine-protein kinase PknH n=1 Tax=Saltatorellus ferox TaxID=2528018 RepID=A0A518ELZ3_9BACT|nr:Serine/threonine-protein kinase PknH [Planctomycetes bacterium Poly30]
MVPPPNRDSEDPAIRDSEHPAIRDPEEPSDDELELAIEIDRLAQVYRERLVREPRLTPEAYAANCPSVPAKMLLPVLKGMGVLARASQRMDGPFALGERVGHYVIRDVIGRGGMGVVYEAEEEGLGRVVALKAMYAAADERVRVRFAREARAAARLDHPSIVPVFGSGSHEGILWYAMRRVDGIGLDEVLRSLRGDDEGFKRDALQRLGAATSVSSSSGSGLIRLSDRERASVAIAHRLADALSYAHSEGVLHRDIKPANVLLERDGTTLLTDFGLCKVDGDASLTRDTDIVGTLRYMPPESFGGQTDGRGDVYGIGLLLLEVLSGRSAFEIDDRRSLMEDILHRDPLPLRDGSLNLSDDLERVVRKAIAKLPEERYATAADLADDLRAVLEGQPVRARATTSPLYLARLFVRRNRALSVTLAGALLALGLGAGFYIVQLREANTAIGEARDVAEWRAAEASVASAEATLRIGDTSGAATALDDVDEAHRGWMWQHLAQRIGRDATALDLEFELVGGSPQGFAASDERGMSAVFGREQIVLLESTDEPGPGLRVRRTLEASAIDIQFHPNGDLCWITRGERSLMRLPLDSASVDGAVPLTLFPLPDRATMLRFSPDGGTALVLDGYNVLVALDAETGEERWRQAIPVPRVDSLEALSATDFVFGTTGGQVIRGSAGDGPLEQVAMHFRRIRGLLAEGGQLLASGGEAGQLDLEAALTGHTRVRVGLESAVLKIARHPYDRDLLAVATESGSVAIVHVKSGAVVRWLGGLRAEPIGLFGSQTPWFMTATLDAQVLCHSKKDHDGRIDLPPAIGNLASPTVSADGRWVSVASNDGLVSFFDLEVGRSFAVPLGAYESGLEPNVHPDGGFACVANLIIDLEAETVVGELDLGDASKPPMKTLRSCWLKDGSLWIAGQENSAASSPRLALWRAEAAAIRAWIEAPGTAPSPLTRVTIGASGSPVQMTAHPDRRAVFVLDREGTLSALAGTDTDVAWSVSLGDTARRFALQEQELFVVGIDGMVRVVDAETGARLDARDWKAAQGIARKSGLNAIAAGPVPGLVSTCTVSGRVEIWSAHDGRRVGTVSSGESYLRFIANVPGTPWLLGAGGFGRLVLIGHGEPPVSSAALARLYESCGSPEARIDGLVKGSESRSGVRTSAAAKAMIQALERSFRYRRSDWTETQVDRLRDLTGQD